MLSAVWSYLCCALLYSRDSEVEHVFHMGPKPLSLGWATQTWIFHPACLLSPTGSISTSLLPSTASTALSHRLVLQSLVAPCSWQLGKCPPSGTGASKCPRVQVTVVPQPLTRYVLKNLLLPYPKVLCPTALWSSPVAPGPSLLSRAQCQGLMKSSHPGHKPWTKRRNQLLDLVIIGNNSYI